MPQVKGIFKPAGDSWISPTEYSVSSWAGTTHRQNPTSITCCPFHQLFTRFLIPQNPAPHWGASTVMMCFPLPKTFFSSFPTWTSLAVQLVKILPTVEAMACSAGDLGLIPESERSPGEGNSNPLYCSCLGNPVDKGAWWAAVHWVMHEVTRVPHNLVLKPPPPSLD